MKGVLLIAGKEVREGIRNRWVVAATLLLATLALTLTFLGAAPAGRVGAGALEVVVVEPLQPLDLPAAADRPADLA